jgi:hypothetical protein
MYIDGVNWHVGVPKVVRRADEFHTAPLGRLEPGRGGKFAFGNERKNTMETGYRAQAVRAACFIGVGDIDAIREIIRNDVVSIGKRRADGYGMVDKQALVVEEIDTDAATWGLMDGRGEPARPVPVATWADVGGVECMIQAVKARPFYWSTRVPVEPCAVPAHADAHLLLQGMPSA